MNYLLDLLGDLLGVHDWAIYWVSMIVIMFKIIMSNLLTFILLCDLSELLILNT